MGSTAQSLINEFRLSTQCTSPSVYQHTTLSTSYSMYSLYRLHTIQYILHTILSISRCWMQALIFLLLWHRLVNSVFMYGVTLFCFTALWATSFVALHKLQFSLLNLTTSCALNIQSYHKKLKQKYDLYGKGTPLTWTFHFAISTFQPYMLNCICNTRQTLELYAFGSFPEFQCLKFIQDINGPCD